MTTVAFRLPDEVISQLDALIRQGVYPNRTTILRAAIDHLIAYERTRMVDQAIVEGYRRIPPDKPDAVTRKLAKRAIEDESW